MQPSGNQQAVVSQVAGAEESSTLATANAKLENRLQIQS